MATRDSRAGADPGNPPLADVSGPRPWNCVCAWAWRGGAMRLKYVVTGCPAHLTLETVKGPRRAYNEDKPEGAPGG